MPIVAALRTMRIIWGALLATTGVYLFLTFSGVLQRAPQPEQPFLFPVYAALAVMIGAASFVLPAISYRQIVAKRELAVVNEPVNEVFATDYRKAAPTVKVFADPRAAMMRAVICFQAPFLLSLALSEAVALFGIMLAANGFDPLRSVPFFAVGAILMLLRFPTERKIIEPFEAALGASIPRDPS